MKPNQPVDNNLGNTIDVAEMLLSGVLKTYYVTGFTEEGEAVQIVRAETDAEKQALVTAMSLSSTSITDVVEVGCNIFYAEGTPRNDGEVEEDDEKTWDDNSDEELNY